MRTRPRDSRGREGAGRGKTRVESAHNTQSRKACRKTAVRRHKQQKGERDRDNVLVAAGTTTRAQRRKESEITVLRKRI